MAKMLSDCKRLSLLNSQGFVREYLYEKAMVVSLAHIMLPFEYCNKYIFMNIINVNCTERIINFSIYSKF